MAGDATTTTTAPLVPAPVSVTAVTVAASMIEPASVVPTPATAMLPNRLEPVLLAPSKHVIAKTATAAAPSPPTTGSTVDHVPLTSTHALYGFALDHFLLAPPPKRLSTCSLFRRHRKPFDLETRLQWEQHLLTAPLTNKLSGDQVRIGLQAFRNISGFMGNRSSGKNQIDHCFKLIRNVMPRATAIKDEIFCQLCKQLTANPDENALLNGWLLLSACLVTFPPSPQLAPFLERFFADHVAKPNDQVAQFAAACLASLHQYVSKGKCERKEIPSLAEIESMRDHTLVSVDVALLDGARQPIGVNSWTTCGELAETVAQRLAVRKRQAFSLFEVSMTGDERRVEATERVLDLVAYWERLGIEKAPTQQKKTTKKKAAAATSSQHQQQQHHHLVYKVYLHIPLDDDMVEDLELAYKQAVHDIIHAVLVCPLDECIQLAAYQMYISHAGAPVPTPAIEASQNDDLLLWMPPHLISKSNHTEIATKIQDAYAALSPRDPTDDTNAMISVHQVRLAYLKICGSLRLYGSTFFAVHNTRNRGMPSELVLAVHQKGISIVSVVNEAVLHQFVYGRIATWGYSANAFVFVVGASPSSHHSATTMITLSTGTGAATTTTDDVEYVFKTKMGKAINDLVAAYVAYITTSSTG